VEIAPKTRRNSTETSMFLVFRWSHDRPHLRAVVIVLFLLQNSPFLFYGEWRHLTSPSFLHSSGFCPLQILFCPLIMCPASQCACIVRREGDVSRCVWCSIVMHTEVWPRENNRTLIIFTLLKFHLQIIQFSQTVDTELGWKLPQMGVCSFTPGGSLGSPCSYCDIVQCETWKAGSWVARREERIAALLTASLSPQRPHRLWGPPGLITNGYRGRGVKLTTLLPLVPELRMCVELSLHRNTKA
jgi:hypothetical protein